MQGTWVQCFPFPSDPLILTQADGLAHILLGPLACNVALACGPPAIDFISVCVGRGIRPIGIGADARSAKQCSRVCGWLIGDWSARYGLNASQDYACPDSFDHVGMQNDALRHSRHGSYITLQAFRQRFGSWCEPVPFMSFSLPLYFPATKGAHRDHSYWLRARTRAEGQNQRMQRLSFLSRICSCSLQCKLTRCEPV